MVPHLLVITISGKKIWHGVSHGFGHDTLFVVEHTSDDVGAT